MSTRRSLNSDQPREVKRQISLNAEPNYSGPQSVISFGQHQGGRLWIEGTGDQPPPALGTQNPDRQYQTGSFHDSFQQWITIQPNQSYCIEPIQDGARYSIVLYTPRRTQTLTPSHLWELRSLGFPTTEITHKSNQDSLSFHSFYLFQSGIT